ncbi:uncharacterized protein LOC143275037 [Babylonia areolata]|uniref:uncharacterized protein LOC143275037 n=1 Tax=Babylonia areolata TaxID=304850 RepID=UPI003FD3767F
MADFKTFIVKRSRPQSDSDRYEIKALKAFLGLSPDLSSDCSANSSTDFSSEYFALGKCPSTASLFPSKVKMAHPTKSVTKQEKRRDTHSTEKRDGQVCSFLDQEKIHRVVRTCQSRTTLQDCQHQDENGICLSSDRKEPTIARSLKSEMSSQQSCYASLQTLQGTGMAYRGNSYGKVRKEQPITTPDELRENAPQKHLPGRGQGCRDTHDHTSGRQEMTQSKEKDDIRLEHKTKDDPQKKKERGQGQEITQGLKERRELSENASRNVPQQETPLRCNSTGARQKDSRRSTPQAAGPPHSKDTNSTMNTVFLRIHDTITDMKILGDMLTARVNTADVELTPTETSIKYRDQFTYCSLTCDDSDDAKKLKELILKNRRQLKPLIDCSFHDYQKKEKQLDDQYHSTKQQQSQFDGKEMLKKDVLCEIDSMSEQVLLKHKQTTNEAEKKIETSKSKLGNIYIRNETLTEIAALESKLEELQKQKVEFNTATEGFRKKLISLLENESYVADVKFLRKQLGVECSRLERALPMYARRQDILQLIQKNCISVLLAETGSGKSTQIVQYLLEAGYGEHGMIVCTQPRKVAVINLATRVAEELACSVGQKVGFKAGVRVRTSSSTKILYMTDHALLNECLTDPDLKIFSCIVVDEAHERSLYTDLLLTMIKRCMRRRPDLKVIITSATIDPEVFINFFGICPVMQVSGRAFPVDVEWEDSASEENEFENYVDAAVNKVIEIHRKEPPGSGDILVFLTSAAEIQKCCDMTQKRLNDCTDFKCLPLHGQLQFEDQQKVFKSLEGNVRKIVFATNCAETSITIDGIKYVVDTGVAKEMVYDAKKKVNSLVVTNISQSSAEQRKGRAGRTAPGKCYRLYSKQSYHTMDKISLPEILKIHLGQALLKLAELGFTPDMYDFVQSPGQDAIEAALKTLHQLGALDDNVITDTGRWIARLPFDPKLGLMTLYGHKHGLLYDTIVLASLMSSGNGLFFRGTSDKDHGKLDKAKLKFSHEGGDGLTSLEVYKAWQAVDERQKTKWCMDNSINVKAIRGVKDSVDEIIQILRKDSDTEIIQQFSDAQDTPDKLRKMIFHCNVSNLCHYLGKERAGYFAAQASRQVHFHPSSTMCFLASHPQWVIYDQLLKTSRDFITGITPVDDAWLQEMNMQLYGFDVEQVRQKKLDVVFTQPAGSHAFFAMVGPRYTKLRRYEKQCCVGNSDDIVIIESSREVGELKVFSTGTAKAVEQLRKMLTEVVSEAINKVQQEVQELTIGSEESGLRVILGQGGQLADILMPHETRKVYITNASDDLTLELVREKFQEFGDICYIHQFPSGKNWGFVIYKTSAQATQAAESTMYDASNVAELERRRVAKHQAEFKAKLSWCRRPCNGTAFIDISPAYMSLFLQVHDLVIGHNLITVKMNKKRPDDSLFLRGLPAEVSEDLIRRSLLHALRYSENKEGIISKVCLLREKVGITDKNDLNQLQDHLKGIFQRQLKMSTVEIKVRPPRGEHDTKFSAEAYFTDPIEGFNACRDLQRRLCIKNAMVDIEPIVSANLQVQRLVFEACKGELDKLKADKLNDIEMNIEKQGSESLLLHLKADDMQSLVQARTFINEVIKGDVLDCNAAPALKHLMTPAGRKMIKEAEGCTFAYVCLDSRTQRLAIHGTVMACTKMRLKINEYLDQVEKGTVEEVTLRGSDRPPGLLKALIIKYDDDLDSLRLEAGLYCITINYHWHKLKLTGTPEGIAKARGMVEEVSMTLMEANQQDVDKEDSISCVACFCPIDTNDLYRLEACAHPYCKDCVKHQVSVAVKDHHLPVICCQEGCQVPLSWRDFNSLSRLGHLKLPDLASSALSAYIMANRDKACFCTTPNCPMVYRLTSEEDAKTFQCPECNMRVCTGCQAQAHEGVTCSMLRSSDKAKSGVEEWASEDRKNRRACPGCNSPIEKDGGCNKMMCDACRTIFCWLCGKKYPTADACYKHLTLRHGGIFDINDLLYN